MKNMEFLSVSTKLKRSINEFRDRTCAEYQKLRKS